MKTKLRIIFMGTPDFAVPALNALIAAGHDVVCVYTQPPRPSGRGHKVTPSAVHLCAQKHNIEVRHPKSLRIGEEQDSFAKLDADVAIVAAYGLILPKAILDAPRFGCINIHGSLLPRWRGAAPIQRAILAGDTKTGICIMQMEEGLDTGPVWSSQVVNIDASTTAQHLHDSLSAIGADLLVHTLPDIISGTIKPITQPETGITYAHKLEKLEGKIDWSLSAQELFLKVRALNPWPGVWFDYQGERYKVIDVLVEEKDHNVPPGTLINDHFDVACGSHILRVLKIQKSGLKPMFVDEFLRGHPLPLGVLV